MSVIKRNCYSYENGKVTEQIDLVVWSYSRRLNYTIHVSLGSKPCCVINKYNWLITWFTSFRRPSLLSNNSSTARNEHVSEKKRVAWHLPESWEHSRSHNAYLTRSLSTGFGRRDTWNKLLETVKEVPSTHCLLISWSSGPCRKKSTKNLIILSFFVELMVV